MMQVILQQARNRNLPPFDLAMASEMQVEFASSEAGFEDRPLGNEAVVLEQSQLEMCHFRRLSLSNEDLYWMHCGPSLVEDLDKWNLVLVLMRVSYTRHPRHRLLAVRMDWG